MAKRKLPSADSSASNGKINISTSSSSRHTMSTFDAALDMLATSVFDKLRDYKEKFEQASGIELSERAMQTRWDEACKRHMVMKAMEDLCCAPREPGPSADSEMQVAEEGRPLPPKLHPGAPARHSLAAAEETEWRKWIPKVGDVVLVELANDQLWPGKIIERQRFFQGRTATRGINFYPVRIYDAEIEPVISIKSRLIPFDLRPDPPLLAPTILLNAYNHARHPESFDKVAEQREKDAAKSRIDNKHSEDPCVKEQKALWNDHVNWVMNERRVEKMRIVSEQRERQMLLASSTTPTAPDVTPSEGRNKRNCTDKDAGIFSVAPINPIIQKHASSPQRPLSPRRYDKKRNGVYTGVGELSPRGRGKTYTPPRVLPSGDEMAVSPSPVPSSRHFDFVSPLGPPKQERQLNAPRSDGMRRSSLEAVKEENLEDEGEWHVVQRRPRRGGSAPCQDIPAVRVDSAVSMEVL